MSKIMQRETSSIDIGALQEAGKRFIENVLDVYIGQRESIEQILVALLTEGHLLIEDVPGVGKTQMAKAVTRSLGCQFKRIQCTPDLLPSDITGLQYFNQKTSMFEFRPGPIMTNIVIVDEINRAMPRTQSCLLECMQERQVTVDVETMILPRPFLLIATQNPVEQEGTFPLPEAQLDRFLMRIGLGYPSDDEEAELLSRYQSCDPLENLKKVIEAEDLLRFQGLCRGIHLDESIRRYIITLTRATRKHADVRLGASPRASLGLHLAAQARAALHGRDYVLPDDVKALAVPVLAHRLIVKTEARLKGRRDTRIISDLLNAIPVPV